MAQLPSAWKGPKSQALGGSSVPAQVVRSSSRARVCAPGALPPPSRPRPTPHSLFLRKRSSCSTAMALTQSRAACSREYRVKAIVAGSRPEARLTRLQPPQGTWRRHGGHSPTEAREVQKRFPRSSASVRLRPAYRPTSARRVCLACLDLSVHGRSQKRFKCGCSVKYTGFRDLGRKQECKISQ